MFQNPHSTYLLSLSWLPRLRLLLLLELSLDKSLFVVSLSWPREDGIRFESYSKVVGTALLFCGYSKLVGSKIEGIKKIVGIKILWLPNLKSNKKIKLGF